MRVDQDQDDGRRTLFPSSCTFVSRQAGQPQPVLQDRLHLVPCIVSVDANQRLGAGEADQQPAAVLQDEFIAVDGHSCR